MVWTKKRPIAGQVVKVVHDDSDKKIKNLKKGQEKRDLVTKTNSCCNISENILSG